MRLLYRCTKADHDQRRPQLVVALGARSACSGCSSAPVRSPSASTRAACSRACCRNRRRRTSSSISRRCRPTSPARSRIRFRASRSACASCGRRRAATCASPRRTRSRRRRCSRTTCRPTLDRRCALAGVRFARALAATTAVAPYVAEELRPGPDAKATTSCSRSVAPTARRSSIRPAPAAWGATRWRSSTTGCACTACGACASSTARSCRRSCRATPTRRW